MSSISISRLEAIGLSSSPTFKSAKVSLNEAALLSDYKPSEPRLNEKSKAFVYYLLMQSSADGIIPWEPCYRAPTLQNYI